MTLLTQRLAGHLHLRHRPAGPRMCPCDYRMANAATDGRGHTTCPICAGTVDVVPDPMHGVVRIPEHRLVVSEARSTEAMTR